MRKLSLILTSIAAFALTTVSVFAFARDISINENNIRFSTSNALEGQTIRIYASASNLSNQDLLGLVRFFDNDKQIGSDQAISIFNSSTDDVFVDWTPLSPGNHRIAVKLYPWDETQDDPNNNWIVKEIFVIQDTDHDGIPNDKDEDDDGDGVNDSDDHFPLNQNEQFDTDGDGTGNGADLDDDNDGVPDEFDDLPLDPNETIDTDGDGIGNVSDTDDDGDNISDTDEQNLRTNPLEADSDQDGARDDIDIFPLDPFERRDTDSDGLGDNLDLDDDNDGVLDHEDEFPLNLGPVIQLVSEKKTLGVKEEFKLDASSSYDLDGEIVSYQWKVDGEEIREGNSLNHTFDKKGKHAITLTVMDDAGETISQNFLVSVLNLKLYRQMGLTLLIILLAMLLFFKYIAPAKIKNHK